MTQWAFHELVILGLRVPVWIPFSLVAFTVTGFVMGANIDQGD